MSSFNELAITFKKIIDDLFSSQGFECRKLFYGDEVFYCGRDILKCLNYSEEKSAIKEMLSKLDKNDKFTIKELEEKYNQSLGGSFKMPPNGIEEKYNQSLGGSFKMPPNGIEDLNQKLISSLDRYEMKYIYINKIALYELIGSSKKLEAKPFKDFIYRTLLPALDNKYKELMNQKDDKIDELIKLNRELLSGVETLKVNTDTLLQDNIILKQNTETLKQDNSLLLEKTDTLLQDNNILKQDNEIINNELNTIKEDQDELKTVIERVLIPNRNLPPRDIDLIHGFAIYKINDNSYYCLRGQNKYIRNKLKDIKREDIIIYNDNNPNPIDFYQRFKAESKRLSDSLLEMILRTLSRKNPNFNPSSIKGKKLIDHNMNKLKYFTVSTNILTLNRSKIEDIIQFYNSLLEEKTEYN